MVYINKKGVKMNNLTKANSMHCFSTTVLWVVKDADPKAKDKAIKDNNCVNCESYQYCKQLAKTLEDFTF